MHGFGIMKGRKHCKIHGFGFIKAQKRWKLHRDFAFKRSESRVKCKVLVLSRPESQSQTKSVKHMILVLARPQILVKYMVLASSTHTDVRKYMALACKGLTKSCELHGFC